MLLLLFHIIFLFKYVINITFLFFETKLFFIKEELNLMKLI